jgi:hypothetical protein
MERLLCWLLGHRLRWRTISVSMRCEYCVRCGIVTRMEVLGERFASMLY